MNMLKASRVVFANVNEVQIEHFSLPEPHAGELLLKSDVTLISPGTERAFLLGLPNTTRQYPMYMGYNHIGRVAQVGEGVTGWQVGDRAASCANHASHAVVKADDCLHVPENLTDEAAVFFNLAAISLQGVRKAQIEIGEFVVVLGAGLIGMLAAQLAKLAGAMEVIIVDTESRRLEIAHQTRINATLVADQALAEQLNALTEGRGAAVVIEAVGRPETILSAFEIAADGARVILLGSARGITKEVDFYTYVHRKGLRVIGAHEVRRPRFESSVAWWRKIDDQWAALRLIANDRLVVLPLITHRFAWSDAAQAYAKLTEWDPSLLGVLLDWRQ
jgi:2-desacetyl-2-hydroxyethyl bacteriochlorophyllide A dehydrogenase